MDSSQRQQLCVQALAGYAPEIGRWLWALEDTRRRTKAGLEGLHPAAVDWSGAAGSNTIGTLLYHIAAIEMDWLHVDILERRFPPEVEVLFPYDVRDEKGRLSTVLDVGLEDHLHRLDAARAVLLRSLQGMTIDDYRRQRRFATYEVTPEWVLHHLSQHEAEHRGQILELRYRAEQALQVS